MMHRSGLPCWEGVQAWFPGLEECISMVSCPGQVHRCGFASGRMHTYGFLVESLEGCIDVV